MNKLLKEDNYKGDEPPIDYEWMFQIGPGRLDSPGL